MHEYCGMLTNTMRGTDILDEQETDIIILTSILFFQWTFAHDCDGNFERENSDLASPLAEIIISITDLSTKKSLSHQS